MTPIFELRIKVRIMNATFKASLITPTISTTLNTRVMYSFGRADLLSTSCIAAASTPW